MQDVTSLRTAGAYCIFPVLLLNSTCTYMLWLCIPVMVEMHDHASQNRQCATAHLDQGVFDSPLEPMCTMVKHTDCEAYGVQCLQNIRHSLPSMSDWVGCMQQ